MFHVVAPLGPSHQHAWLALLDEALAVAKLPEDQQPPWPPHLTLVSYSGLTEQAATDALDPSRLADVIEHLAHRPHPS